MATDALCHVAAQYQTTEAFGAVDSSRDSGFETDRHRTEISKPARGPKHSDSLLHSRLLGHPKTASTTNPQPAATSGCGPPASTDLEWLPKSALHAKRLSVGSPKVQRSPLPANSCETKPRTSPARSSSETLSSDSSVSMMLL